ncbi:ketoacyl-ACP synthase III [Helicobacter pylori]|uniref:Beta-ketoacyl-[acyl-carrier-protein] synthase III n=3 Tax=Helicobacter pylori TaxID=210 RepID=FABH_HELPS|nr:ketoacyl-ACP synthase III [Helicobacter pylori]B2US32.1 RecName: Full=Beta-ketoacyl-[acyl-carrier-protein] synthase III; Short=Beta-ketoacyl-ACP synthase III; Short=KAS III; AltName: Full=3-oxoacyl-[acyl-carrier-protein] synthase 3; AltName: Full=3-oxoacyl-[acyl-carrier-protein] synthase III [Helicobacter pylori Shi470]ACD47664.1 3-oxoacyl-(acyl carrier protein) synthase III [Helicobacter pylori Shi470]ADO03412.1 3-oxoacyl-(acyl carrier protein) synthase III [Helicobacter pylori Cuz20]MBH027
MEFYASLKSIAMHVPSERVKNAEFQQFLDTSDEWIEKRTGIKERRFANDEEKSSDLGVIAAKQAIERAHLTPKDIDLVVVATLSPDFLAMPSTACVLSAKLGIENKPAFDISAACTGFIYLLSVAKAYVESGMCENVLIVGAEKTSSVLDFKDRGTCILFGDGAGACVIGRTKRLKESVLDVQISANGNFSNYLYTPRTLKPTPFNAKEEASEPFLRMKGNEVFKLAVKTLLKDVEMILEKNALKPEDVRLFIPHQANFRIIQAVREHLDFKDEQVVLTVHKYGNTSAASIPMAMCEAYEEGRLKKGDLMLLDAFGGGLTWGSALVYFGGS